MIGGGKGTCLSILFYLIWLNWPILANFGRYIFMYRYISVCVRFFVLVPS